MAGRYEIRLEHYDNNWKEVTSSMHDGAMLEQMKELLHGVKHMQGDRAIRIFIYDSKEEKEVPNSEHRY